MPLRIGTNFAICFAVLIGSTLGLNRGMVLCVDGAGQLALESAHEQHARHHNEGADHLLHELPADAEHGRLHAAIETCFDVEIGKVHLRAAATTSLRPGDFPATACLTLPNLDLHLSLKGDWSRADAASGAIPRPEIACLNAIVLLV